MAAISYRRVLLKLGGEAFAGPQGFGIDPNMAAQVASKIQQIKELDIEIAIVLGAGNIWRGQIGLEHGMERATADHMGMLATVINALALADALERIGLTPRVQTAIEMRAIAEPYIRLRAIRHLEKGRILILAAGTGNPYFTTDTAAALRAMEIDADSRPAHGSCASRRLRSFAVTLKRACCHIICRHAQPHLTALRRTCIIFDPAMIF